MFCDACQIIAMKRNVESTLNFSLRHHLFHNWFSEIQQRRSALSASIGQTMSLQMLNLSFPFLDDFLLLF